MRTGARSSGRWSAVGLSLCVSALLLAIPSPAQAASPSPGALPAAVHIPGHTVVVRDLPPADAVGRGRPQQAAAAPRQLLVPDRRAYEAAKAGPRGPAGDALAGPTPGPLQARAATITSPVITGISLAQEQPLAAGADPPDTQVAAGPSSLLEMVNLTGQVFSRAGAPLGALFTLRSFFLVPSRFQPTDPRVAFDPLTGRWYATLGAVDASNTGMTFLGVSATSDPQGVWTIYQVPDTSGLFCDQPKLGYSTDKFVIGCSDFDAGGGFRGGVIIVLSKSQALAGASSLAIVTSTPDPGVLAPVPAQMTDGGATAFVISNGSFFRRTSVDMTRIMGEPASGTTTLSHGSVTMPLTFTPPNAEQRGSGSRIDTGDDRFMSVIYYGGNIWTTSTTGCTLPDDATPRACIRLVEIAVTRTSPALEQSFDVGVPGSYLYYPTLALDNAGNAVVGFTKSSIADYPSVSAAIQLATAPNTLGGITLVQAGSGPYSGARWGDYGSAAQDPSDGSQVWVAGEYSIDATNWGTSIAAIRPVPIAPSGPYVALAKPVRVLDTRTETGGHHAPFGQAEHFDVAIAGNPRTTLPATGVSSVVVNATITGASAGSLLTLFPAGLPMPTASNLNFGPDQQLANLATVQIGPGGSITVFNALGVVDVILDVEGYFQSSSGPAAGLFNPLPAPARILDTRTPTGGHNFQVGPQQSLVLHVAGAPGQAGAAGVPASGANAVAFNLTAVQSTAPGALSVGPGDSPLPLQPAFSNVNFPAYKNVPNRVISRLTAAGNIVVYNSAGSLDVIVDVTGWFSDGDTATTGYNFTALSPQRLMDTRRSGQAFGDGFPLQVTVRFSLARAVMVNVTGIAPSQATYLSVYPDNPTPPATSDLNLIPGAIVANLCIPAVNPADHLIDVWNGNGRIEAVVDLAGYFA